MTNKDNPHIISLRRCDLHAIFTMLSLGNKDTVKAAWESADNFADNYDD